MFVQKSKEDHDKFMKQFPGFNYEEQVKHFERININNFNISNTHYNNLVNKKSKKKKKRHSRSSSSKSSSSSSSDSQVKYFDQKHLKQYKEKEENMRKIEEAIKNDKNPDKKEVSEPVLDNDDLKLLNRKRDRSKDHKLVRRRLGTKRHDKTSTERKTYHNRDDKGYKAMDRNADNWDNRHVNRYTSNREYHKPEDHSNREDIDKYLRNKTSDKDLRGFISNKPTYNKPFRRVGFRTTTNRYENITRIDHGFKKDEYIERKFTYNAHYDNTRSNFNKEYDNRDNSKFTENKDKYERGFNRTHHEYDKTNKYRERSREDSRAFRRDSNERRKERDSDLTSPYNKYSNQESKEKNTYHKPYEVGNNFQRSKHISDEREPRGNRTKPTRFSNFSDIPPEEPKQEVQDIPKDIPKEPIEKLIEKSIERHVEASLSEPVKHFSPEKRSRPFIRKRFSDVSEIEEGEDISHNLKIINESGKKKILLNKERRNPDIKLIKKDNK
jgi:hypothetical protein